MTVYDQVGLMRNVIRYVRNSPQLQDLVNRGVVGTSNGVPWVFRPGDVNPAPNAHVESSGKAAVTFLSYDHWFRQSQRHTMMYPILRMYIFADRSRDSNGSPIADDASDRCKEVFDSLNVLFHDPANKIHKFDQFHIISTTGGQLLRIENIEDADGAVQGEASYELVI